MEQKFSKFISHILFYSENNLFFRMSDFIVLNHLIKFTYKIVIDAHGRVNWYQHKKKREIQQENIEFPFHCHINMSDIFAFLNKFSLYKAEMFRVCALIKRASVLWKWTQMKFVERNNWKNNVFCLFYPGVYKYVFS